MVTKPRGKPLTAAFIKAVSRPGRYGDGHGGHGLSLLVKPMVSSGRISKTWSQRLRIDGQQRTFGLGGYPTVTLAEARKRVLANRRMVAEGGDPRVNRAPTFEKATDRVIAIHRAKWTPRSKTEKQWRNLFAAHVLPRIGNKRVDQVSAADVLAILSPMWHTKVETARKTERYIAAVMKWCVAQEFRNDNPADDRIRDALGKHTPQTQHMKALPHAEVAGALRIIETSAAHWSTIAALKFLTLTATRSGEVRLAIWNEINFATATWTIPGERTKTRREHRVPLSTAALAVLAEAAGRTGGRWADLHHRLTGRAMSVHATISQAIQRKPDVGCVPHGMRSSFRDWCGETGVPREVAEQALSHVVKGVEGAYARIRFARPAPIPVMESLGALRHLIFYNTLVPAAWYRCGIMS